MCVPRAWAAASPPRVKKASSAQARAASRVAFAGRPPRAEDSSSCPPVDSLSGLMAILAPLCHCEQSARAGAGFGGTRNLYILPGESCSCAFRRGWMCPKLAAELGLQILTRALARAQSPRCPRLEFGLRLVLPLHTDVFFPVGQMSKMSREKQMACRGPGDHHASAEPASPTT